MEVVMHPLLLVPLASVVTWLACRWWYGGQLRALEAALSREPREEDGEPEDRASDSGASPQLRSTSAGSADARRLTSLGGGPVLPFLDTSPLSHHAEPEPDLFGHLPELGPRSAGERPYLN